ncbi:hypothetical protein PVA17_21100 [Lysinibacillus sp. CNPSo 3705]|uniref:hypothetical protein n=1 Tax=Lysinibacillus sp. CNPSo 3705 TaxID=3028148 RepID=UPI0023647D65|nr:hypothetical protein [Lysinibacillus sp. CNPSo 3705]MDD1505222.1 hypothetical protein [Lysinibacillus sp. CNPSo 3705]
MGKTIVSWSPVKGQGCTSNTAALAAVFALNYQVNSLITHTQFSESILEEVFNKAHKMVGFDSGLKALERLAKSVLLKPEAVIDYTETIYNNRLDILGGSQTHQGDMEILQTLLNVTKEAYDLVWIDTETGPPNEMTEKVLKAADVILVTLPQNKFVLDRFFTQKEYPAFLDEKNVVYLVGSYDPEAALSVRKIKGNYKLKNKVMPVLYSHLFNDAFNTNSLTEFFHRNKSVSKKHPVYEFTDGLKTINHFLAKQVDLVRKGDDEEE